MSPSPTAEGFKLIFRRPAIALGEIAWRWSVGAAGWFLSIFFLIEYAGSLPVRALDRLLIGTQHPLLVLRALQHILHGSVVRFTETAVMLAIALTVMWIVGAMLGRAATVKALLEEFRIPQSEGMPRRIFFSLLWLNIFRVAITLAAAVCAVGAVLISSSVWASTRASAADAARLCFAVLILTWAAWSMLNWLLSTVAIYAVAQCETAFQAISSTVRALHEKPGSFIAAGTWFGLVHLGTFIFAMAAAFSVLGMLGTLPSGAALLLGILIAIAYCAVADFLYTGRMAAYLAIIGDDFLNVEEAVSSLPIVPAAVDRSELILSDVSVPAT